MENIKLIDCFSYFNEKELLELRIRLLYDKVHKFVISEANQTHSGISKDYELHKVLENIDDPLNKIEVIQIDFSNSSELDNWKRERIQRDSVLQILHKFDDDCLFYFGDCDEVLNPNYIEWICNVAKENPLNILRTPLDFLSCRADLRVFTKYDTPAIWNSAYVSSKIHLGKYTPSQIRESFSLYGALETSDLKKHIDFHNIIITIDSQEVSLGWHFSWMGDNQRRVTKYKSYLHYDHDFLGKSGPKMAKYIEKYTPSEGKGDLLNRDDHILKRYDINLLPDLILSEEKFKNFFLP